MEKQKNDMKVQMNSNNIIIAGIAFIVLMATGILPFLIKLVVGLVVGVIGLVVGLVVGAIGLVIGLGVGAIGLAIGLLPILIPVAIIYYLVNGRDNAEKPKHKHDFDVDFS